MTDNAWLYIVVLLISVFVGSIAQVILKKAAMKRYDSKLQEYLNLRVIFAYVLFVGTTFLSILAYKEIPLSMGPVLQTTSYIYITIFGIKIFGEHVGKQKIAALLLIIIGIVICTVWG